MANNEENALTDLESTSKLGSVEELRLRAWARVHYVPKSERSSSLHPVVLDEMRRKDRELGLTEMHGETPTISVSVILNDCSPIDEIAEEIEKLYRALNEAHIYGGGDGLTVGGWEFLVESHNLVEV